MTTKGHSMGSKRIDPALPELEQMLTTTAAAQMKGSRESLGRRIAGARGSRIAALGLTCLAFAGTAMAATGVWNPAIGTEAPIEGHGSALHGQGTPVAASTPLPAAVTDALGVLRRAPTAQDRGAEVESTLAAVSFVDGVRPDSTRFLAAGDRGQATILLSVEKSLNTTLTGLESICIFRPGAYGYGHASDVPQACFDLPSVLAGRGYADQVNSPPGSGLAFGLVPDGVASVTAEFADAPDVAVPVSDNYWELSMSGAQLGDGSGDFSGGVQHVVWRDADGVVVPQLPHEEGSGEPSEVTERIVHATPGSPKNKVESGGN